ncbi:hypothetical protein KSP40_PGU011270 [Platanthera guangdongensis]|uniref:C2H2-type domain-containing protein n=1 Tax=Platanthera guangdongensis TaxID=2320717 RepID=A0ABR2LQ78_9ASPA
MHGIDMSAMLRSDRVFVGDDTNVVVLVYWHRVHCTLAGTEEAGWIKMASASFCLKEFQKSQALGGHLNAHKERMNKKSLELESRKTNINCYLQPFIKSHGATL